MQRWWRSPIFWVVVVTVVFLAFYGLVLIFRHLNLLTAHYDLGNMDQVMWQSLRGHWFHMMDAGNGTLISRFTYHADVLLLGYLPFYLLAPSALTLTLAQLLLVASAVFPLYWFAKKMLPSWVAAIAAVMLLTYPPLIWNLLFDVHAVTLVIPLFIWAAWAATERRWGIFWVCIILLPLAKEEVGVTVALFSAIVAWKIRPRWIGLTAAVYGLVVTAVMLLVVIPHARQSGDHFFLRQYSEYGTTTIGVVKGMISQPLRVVGTLLNQDSRGYMYHLIGPFAALPVLALPYVLVATPEYAINALSSFDGMRTIVFQYTSVLTPILLLSMVIGLSRWWRWTERYRRWQRLGLGVVVISNLFFVWHDAPIPFGRHSSVMNVFQPSPYRADIRRIKKLVQPTDALAVSNLLGPQFTRRDNIWSFPYALDRADAAVVLLDPADTSDSAVASRKKIDELRRDPQWSIVLEHDQLLFFRRVGR